MPTKRFDIQVSGQLPAGLLDDLTHEAGDIRMRTVLRGQVRDQAALQGLLWHLNSLGLDLVELRQLQSARRSEPPPGTADQRPHAHARVVEVLVEGPIGELALSSLAEHGDVVQAARRLSVPDPHVLGEVVIRLAGAGAEFEYVRDLPDPDVAGPRASADRVRKL